MKSINIEDLKFGYKSDFPIFNKAFLEIPLNEISFLQGENGSGKTTLCRILSGLERSYTGSIQIGDLNIKQAAFAELARSIIYLKQEPQANVIAATPDADLKLWQYGLNSENETSNKLRNRVMKRLKIDELKNKPIWELSGGQIKRIGLAALLINYDKYWILDEPVAGLDNALINIFIQIIEERKSLGKGCLIISHQEDYFSNLIDKYYLIQEQKFTAKLRGINEIY